MTEPVETPFGTESEPEAPGPETATPLPPVDADPQQVAEEAAAAEPGPDPLLADVPDSPAGLKTALTEIVRLLRYAIDKAHAHE